MALWAGGGREMVKVGATESTVTFTVLLNPAADIG
jgi:hypothetical protein